MNTKDKIKVMEAFDAKIFVEYRTRSNQEDGTSLWSKLTTVNPVWNWVKYEYRIYSRIQKLVVNIDADGKIEKYRDVETAMKNGNGYEYVGLTYQLVND